MSRALKYRLWDNEEKEYRKWQEYFDDAENVVLRPDGQLYYALGDRYYDALLVEYELTEDGRYTLEQYTGLKDRNGKEIYEGDRIKIEGSDTIYTVKYGRGIWVARFGDESGDNICLYHYVQKDMVLYAEVIGNIHEPIDKSDQV